MIDEYKIDKIQEDLNKIKEDIEYIADRKKRYQIYGAMIFLIFYSIFLYFVAGFFRF